MEEADRRGLSNINNFIDAKRTLLQEKNVKMFERMRVLSEKENQSRYEVLVENYNKINKIEALTAIEMVERDILPVVHRYIGEIASCIIQVKETGINIVLETQKRLLEDISVLAVSADKKVRKLKEIVDEVSSINDVTEQSVAYRDEVIPVMRSLREDIDQLEALVDAHLTKYI